MNADRGAAGHAAVHGWQRPTDFEGWDLQMLDPWLS